MDEIYFKDAEEHFGIVQFILGLLSTSWERVATLIGSEGSNNEGWRVMRRFLIIAFLRHQYNLATKDNRWESELEETVDCMRCLTKNVFVPDWLRNYVKKQLCRQILTMR